MNYELLNQNLNSKSENEDFKLRIDDKIFTVLNNEYSKELEELVKIENQNFSKTNNFLTTKYHYQFKYQ
jgi:hypothetical protein